MKKLYKQAMSLLLVFILGISLCAGVVAHAAPYDDLGDLLDMLDSENLQELDYTNYSWFLYTNALNSAKSVYGNPTSPEPTIQTAYNNLNSAFLALVNIRVLFDKFNECLDKIKDKYTSDSWDAFIAARPGAIAAANFIFSENDPDKYGYGVGMPISSDAIAAAIKDIQDAIDLLVCKPEDTVTITFVNDDEDMGELTGDLVFEGVPGAATPAIVAPGTDPKPGYKFAGWDDDIPLVYPTEDLTITGSWEEDPAQWVTVTFVNGDPTQGTLTGTLVFRGITGESLPAAIVAPGTTPKPGYQFAGWFDGFTKISVPTEYPAVDMTITGYWEENYDEWVLLQFVSEDVKKGTIDGADGLICYVYGIIGSDLTPPDTIPEKGYEFDEWLPDVPDQFPASAETYTATWKIKEDDWVTVTFESADEDMGTVDDAVDNVLEIKGIIGSDLTPPETTREDGYEFDKWDPIVPATFPALAETYTATWKIKADEWVTVTFESDDVDMGTVNGAIDNVLEIDGIIGKPLPAPGTTPKPGYEFDVWSPSVPATFPNAPATYTATWKEDTSGWVTVYFVSDDEDMGTVNGATDNVLEVKGIIGSALTPPGTTREDGYEFDKWDPDVPATFPASPEIYTATWKIKADEWVTVTFKSADVDKGTVNGAIDNVLEITGIIGSTLKVQETTRKDGYEFDVWSPSVPATFPASAATYTATWKEKADEWATITFVSADVTQGTLSGTLSVRGIIGKPVTASYPATVPEDGYAFDKWSAAIPSVFSADMTITATWTAVLPTTYTVTFIYYNDAGKLTCAKVVVAAGAAATPPDADKRPGYTLTGWCPADFSNVTKDMSVIALYELNKYTVTFVNWDEAVLKTETVNHGAAATPPTTDPTREGYTFIGWDVDFSNITGPLTVTAVFESNAVTTLKWKLYYIAVNGWYKLQDYLNADTIHTPESIADARNLLNNDQRVHDHGQAVVSSYSPWAGERYLNKDGDYTQAEINEWAAKLFAVLKEAKALLKKPALYWDDYRAAVDGWYDLDAYLKSTDCSDLYTAASIEEALSCLYNHKYVQEHGQAVVGSYSPWAGERYLNENKKYTQAAIDEWTAKINQVLDCARNKLVLKDTGEDLDLYWEYLNSGLQAQWLKTALVTLGLYSGEVKDIYEKIITDHGAYLSGAGYGYVDLFGIPVKWEDDAQYYTTHYALWKEYYDRNWDTINNYMIPILHDHDEFFFPEIEDDLFLTWSKPFEAYDWASYKGQLDICFYTQSVFPY